MDGLEDLLKIENDFKKNLKVDNSGLWNLIKTIHSNPLTRDKIGLEVVPLVPFIIDYKDEGSEIISLMALSTNEESYKVQSYVIWKPKKFFEIDEIQATNIGKLPENKMVILSKKEFEEYSSEEIISSAEKMYFEGIINQNIPEKLIGIYKEIADSGNSEQMVKEAPVEDNEEGFEIILSKLEKIVEGTENKEFIIKMEKKINSLFFSSQFKVAVVGEFSTGKSTLINKIINKDILPTSIMPTTSLLTKIKYGVSEGIYKIGDNNKSEKIDFSKKAISECMNKADKKNKDNYLFLEVEDEWLKNSDVQLIDTPGAADVDVERIDMVYDLVSTCDGVIFVLSALRALSLSEKTFMEQHILSKKVPHIAVVISRFDQIEEEDRALLIKSLTEQLGDLNSNIKIFIPQECGELNMDESYKQICGINSIKKNIEQWVNDANNKILKNMQYSNLVLEVLGMTKLYYETRKKLLLMSQSEREAEFKKLDDKINSNRLIWEDYRLVMESNANLNSEWVRSELISKKDYILEDMLLELKGTPNPKLWWSEYYPVSFRRKLEAISKTIESGLLARISKDLNWLDLQLTKDFGGKFKFKDVSNITGGDDYKVNKQNIGLMDFNMIRVAVRAGMALSTVIGYVFFGPLGIVASAGGTVVSEVFLNKSINKQKEKLEEFIPNEISKAFENIYELLRKRLNEVYRTIINNLNKNEMEWFDMEKKMLYSEFGGKNVGADQEIKKIDLEISIIDEMIITIKSMF